ncbi:hypothetical protein FOL47_000764 [Perkinsus chesapeaki]|uniref:C2HC/C3H-type domain-containing protein n=1 Tax=Perkinsus chesapeaki TaxID=330153 RepID=A0A7J6MLM8_PERCH|nr:hypothetical protein FOL47_000764 [Perkinsus chesapeaki]
MVVSPRRMGEEEPEWVCAEDRYPNRSRDRFEPCPFCGRTFNPVSLEKHSKVCRQVFGKSSSRLGRVSEVRTTKISPPKDSPGKISFLGGQSMVGKVKKVDPEIDVPRGSPRNSMLRSRSGGNLLERCASPSKIPPPKASFSPRAAFRGARSDCGSPVMGFREEIGSVKDIPTYSKARAPIVAKESLRSTNLPSAGSIFGSYAPRRIQWAAPRNGLAVERENLLVKRRDDFKRLKLQKSMIGNSVII